MFLYVQSLFPLLFHRKSVVFLLFWPILRKKSSTKGNWQNLREIRASSKGSVLKRLASMRVPLCPNALTLELCFQLLAPQSMVLSSLLRGPQAQFLCCSYSTGMRWFSFPVHTSAVSPNLWSLIFRIFCWRSFIDLAENPRQDVSKISTWPWWQRQGESISATTCT